MTSKRKTYAVNGMMEWVAIIMCGKAQVSVQFTGGSLSGYGVTPATYTTENPFIQTVIEKSDYFKSGRIFLKSECDGTGKYKPVLMKPADETQQMTAGDNASEEAVHSIGNNADEVGNEEAGSELSAEEAEAAGYAVVQVSDIDDARDYLVDEFGVTRTSLRSNVSVLRFAEEHKIKFMGLDD